MTNEQLNDIIAIADGYAARMKIVREYFNRREPIPEEHKRYLAILSDGEAVKAFEALRPLVERVRMFERQTVELANRLSLSCMETVSPKTWLSITEEAAREADV